MYIFRIKILKDFLKVEWSNYFCNYIKNKVNIILGICSIYKININDNLGPHALSMWFFVAKNLRKHYNIQK